MQLVIVEEGLKENGISYWQRAKEVSEDLIANASAYGFQLYNDVDDVWAQANNRGSVNKEYLFVVSGLDGTDANANNITYPNATNLLYAYTRPNPGTLQDIYKTSSTSSNYLLGTHNQSGVMAPTRHAIEVFGDCLFVAQSQFRHQSQGRVEVHHAEDLGIHLSSELLLQRSLPGIGLHAS